LLYFLILVVKRSIPVFSSEFIFSYLTTLKIGLVVVNAWNGGIELRVLKSNDATAIFEYLKQLCLAVFAIYLTINIKKDINFRFSKNVTS